MCTSLFEEKKKLICDKITAFLDFEILQFLAKSTMECLYNQHLLQFLGYKSEPEQRCFRRIEALHLL